MPACPIDKNVVIPPYSSGCGCDRESIAAMKAQLDQYVIVNELPAPSYPLPDLSAQSLLSVGCNCAAATPNQHHYPSRQR